MKIRTYIYVAILGGMGWLSSASQLTGAEVKKQILVVIGADHHKPGTHEIAAGGRLMAYALNHVENSESVEALVTYTWPEDKHLIDSVDSVVFIGDQFPAIRFKNSEESMKDLEKMVTRGCGIVCIHFATGLGRNDVPDDGDHPLLHWTGGYFAQNCKHEQSIARIYEASILPSLGKEHPIRQGWDIFRIRDEPYVRNWFGKDGFIEGAFPLAVVQYPPNSPRYETTAWGIERKDGGRGAGITLPHFYQNWKNEDLRRFILNTIFWTAKAEVPEGGVKTTLPDLQTFKPRKLNP